MSLDVHTYLDCAIRMHCAGECPRSSRLRTVGQTQKEEREMDKSTHIFKAYDEPSILSYTSASEGKKAEEIFIARAQAGNCCLNFLLLHHCPIVAILNFFLFPPSH